MRFDAEGYGFRPGDGDPGKGHMYVLMDPDPGTFSGWGPSDQNTYVNSSAFGGSTSSLGGLIAHEEEHQSGEDGPNHNTGIANATQATCS
jgi:hypothetical protein